MINITFVANAFRNNRASLDNVEHRLSQIKDSIGGPIGPALKAPETAAEDEGVLAHTGDISDLVQNLKLQIKGVGYVHEHVRDIRSQTGEIMKPSKAAPSLSTDEFFAALDDQTPIDQIAFNLTSICDYYSNDVYRPLKELLDQLENVVVFLRGPKNTGGEAHAMPPKVDTGIIGSLAETAEAVAFVIEQISEVTAELEQIFDIDDAGLEEPAAVPPFPNDTVNIGNIKIEQPSSMPIRKY